MEKVALVTGGARRVGAGTVRALHQAGWKILLHYRHSATDAQMLADELNAADRIRLFCMGSTCCRQRACPNWWKQLWLTLAGWMR